MAIDDMDGLLETDMDSGRGVFVPSTSTALVLNESAARIWDLARDGSTISQIADQIARECGVDSATIRDSVVKTVNTLGDHGLLHAADTP